MLHRFSYQLAGLAVVNIVAGRGSHRVFARPGVDELVNIQYDDGQAKLYQVRQIAALVRRYALKLEDSP